jgi:hypothetical protein
MVSVAVYYLGRSTVNMTNDAQSLEGRCGTSVHATEALLQKIKQAIMRLALTAIAESGLGRSFWFNQS